MVIVYASVECEQRANLLTSQTSTSAITIIKLSEWGIITGLENGWTTWGLATPVLHWVSWLCEVCFDGIGRWALITQFSHTILLDHKQSLHFWYTTASEWHSGEQFFILNEAEVVDFKHTARLNLSHTSKWIPRTWRSRMNTLICMTSIANTYTHWQSISLVQLLKKSVICTMTAVLPKVQQSSRDTH